MAVGTDGFGKGALNELELLEGKLAFVELTILHLLRNNAFDEVGDGLLAVFVETARSSFEGIGNHNDGRLFGARFGAGVAEVAFVNEAAIAAHQFDLLVVEVVD